MYLHFTPALLHSLYPDMLWRMPRNSKTIYLTFDDGPIPEVTPHVLELLRQWNAKATFFCVGENVDKHPGVLRQVTGQGHRLGNHTYHHLKGTGTDTNSYLQNVKKCQQSLQAYLSVAQQLLFRPPYGRFTKAQRKALAEDYRLVMWDVLSADYDPGLSPETCLRKSIRYTRPGSIIVFHDSLKAWERLQWVLPRYLEHFSSKGYSFAAL
ncbi:polysaccharide deacetylase [Flammeovirgaceae bacterium 311]|nr:polysaccharide deacetylase [Flammeovirgaceae bacterium 311]